ncbi:MAG: T9SS type A sorting domain-containing protein [Candidatus Eisenbacteria bacterium]|nr:T9SS type A sorting domain-containing protein [Candidatus Eisenbacteria bacterium]
MTRTSPPRLRLVMLVSFLILGTGSSVQARNAVRLVEAIGADRREGLPSRVPGTSRADTFCFGYVQTMGGALYAVPGETWTFDHGGGGLEGWYAVDLSADPAAYGRRIDAAAWAGHGNAVPAPLITGAGSAWFGLHEDEADALCWSSGLGYGNGWCQRWVSPPITYSGSGDVSITFDYWNDTEEGYDFTRCRLERGGNWIPLLEVSGQIGDPSTATFAHASLTAPASLLSGWNEFRVVLEFTSDGGYSDEDGDYATDFGPFGCDDLSLSGGVSPTTYDFETDAQGWTGEVCGAVGTFLGIAPLAAYNFPDLCECALSGNVMEVHDGVGPMGEHPAGQHVQLFSPPIDRGSLGPSYNDVFATWDIYADLPQANGVFIREGWNYYPYICPATGEEQWSGRIGNSMTYYLVPEPGCFSGFASGTGDGVPADASLVSLVFELFASCDAFGIPSSVCTGQSNFSPVWDNVRICATQSIAAPAIAFDPGGRFQDGYGQGAILSTTNGGNADSAFDLHRDLPIPDLLGDSLVVSGPIPTTSTRWEAQLWWRLPRVGPGQASIAGYAVWRDKVADGRTIVGPTAEFTSGRMDSVQVLTQVAKHKFWSEFREDDDDFVGEGVSSNEMIRDGILAPGTQVEYFISANYICTPGISYLLPDTIGGNLLEFEILPRWRIDAGTSKFPCTLLIDLQDGGRATIEDALNVALTGATPGSPIPALPRWDRFDYMDAASNWNAAFARSAGGNNGIHYWQLRGYRQIVVHSGSLGAAGMEDRDFEFLDTWLTDGTCGGNNTTNRQGFMLGGEAVGNLLTERAPTFLTNLLGASVSCDSYRDPGCGPSGPADEGDCVRLETASGALFSSTDEIDLYGNGCPTLLGFDVLGASSGGVGGRTYVDYDREPPASTSFAQIARSVTGTGSANYRSVVTGYSFHRQTIREANDECGIDGDRRAAAAGSEFRAAMTWIFGSVANIPSLCVSFDCGLDVDDAASGPRTTSGIWSVSPNPFNPRTTIRFSLAAAGKAELLIYDVSGRQVRALVEQELTAGAHTAVWDGTDDDGRRVVSGVYWSQLRAGGYESHRKMVVIP